jgi:hypothetical protein
MDRAFLHNTPEVHDSHAVGNLSHNAEVVGDKKKRHAEILLQLAQERKKIRLGRHIQSRCRLIGDQ